MSRTDDCLDVIVLAGARIKGEYAKEANTTVKALAPVGGKVAVDLLVSAIRESPGVQRICLVGPESVRGATKAADLWTKEEGSAIENLRTGIESLGSTTRRVLITAADLPFVTPKAVSSFIEYSSIDAEVNFPVAYESEFHTMFPDMHRSFIRLHDGGVTLGGMAIVDSRIVSANLSQLARALAHHSTTSGVAMTLGPALTLRMLGGRLTLADVEHRSSELTECRCRAIPGASPTLAFDMETIDAYHYACKRMRRILLDKGECQTSQRESPRRPPPGAWDQPRM